MTRHLAPTPGQPDESATQRVEADKRHAARLLTTQVELGNTTAAHLAAELFTADPLAPIYTTPPATAVVERGSWVERWWPALVLAAVAAASLGWIGWWAL